MIFFQEITLILLDNYSESWFKPCKPAGGVARCSTYLFPMRSPGSHPPFRGFPLYALPLVQAETGPRRRIVRLARCTASATQPVSRQYQLPKLLCDLGNATVTPDSDPGSSLDSRLRGNDGEPPITVRLQDSLHHSAKGHCFSQTL